MAPNCRHGSDSGPAGLRGRTFASRRSRGDRQGAIRERRDTARPGGAERAAQHELPARSRGAGRGRGAAAGCGSGDGARCAGPGDVVAQARKDFERKDYDAADAKLRSVLNEDPGYTLARALAAEINVARGPVTVAPRLKTRENRKVTLQLRDAQTKMVFEVLQRETGINFILDKDIKSDGK